MGIKMDGAPRKSLKDEITDAIEEILGKNKIDQTTERANEQNRRYSIDNILIIATEYDYFLMEEGGRLNEILLKTYKEQGKGRVPDITHTTEERALTNLQKRDHDIIFLFNPPNEKNATLLAKELKQKRPHIPIVIIGKDTPIIDAMITDSKEGILDWVFTWAGDGKIFIDIVQFVEDTTSLQRGMDGERTKKILIVSGQPRQYSRLLYETTATITEYMRTIMKEELSRTQRIQRLKRRPSVLIATTAEETKEIYEKYKKDLVCVVINTETRTSKYEEMISIAIQIRETNNELQILLTSKDPSDKELAETNALEYLQSNNTTFTAKYNDFIRTSLGPTILRIPGENGTEALEIADIKTLEQNLWSLPEKILDDWIRDETIEKWLETRLENELADNIRQLTNDEKNTEELRKKIIGTMREHRKRAHRGTVTKYSRKTYGTHARFSRIGNGAMGGKARGLAFMDKIISTYMPEYLLPQIKITIPRTIVLCSDIFDDFLEENNLLEEEIHVLSDERIAIKFMEADLPATVLGDLRSFIRETKVPLVVRSSSLLEDALHHPFAGVYASLLLPNESWETDIRFQELCTAIKYVFSSVFFQKARTYMSTIQNTSQDEKMAVIIEELIGQKHGNIYYPTISGVAKSYDYYPTGSCKSTDGVVNVALGLGKAVVEGENSYRFCPLHPKTPKHGALKDLLAQSQKEFFAVDLTTYTNIVKLDEDSTIKKYSIVKAEPHGNLVHTASTYNQRDDRIYPGIEREGPRVIDFAPILQLNTVPLPTAIRLLLRISEISLGTPVEIEFAMNIPEEHNKISELYLLQVRSMLSNENDKEIDIGEHAPETIIAYTDNVLGNGVIDNIRDIIYVKKRNYDLSQNQKIVPQVRKMNQKMIQNKTPYILIGPGRWGSTDPWLGIPVTWSDIAGAKSIIETPVEERIIDPSQGSHFFHNMIAANTSYFTITPTNKGTIDWEYLDNIEAVEETENMRHIQLHAPAEIRIDGNNGEGVILKPHSETERR